MSSDPFSAPSPSWMRFVDGLNLFESGPRQVLERNRIASKIEALDGTVVSIGFPSDMFGSPWMIVRRPGGEWWMAFDETSILRGMNDE